MLGFGIDAGEFLRSIGQVDREASAKETDEGIHIVSIVSNDGGLVKVRLLVENEAGSENLEFILLCELVSEMVLSIGDIDGDTASEIERSAEITRAYISACSSLAFADSSCRALVRKLIQKGFDRDIAEDAVGVAMSRGLIDENNTVESRVRIFLGKRWGRGRILAKLFEEGFSEGAINYAREILGEIDFVELCAEHIEKKYREIPGDRLQRQKMCASLMRYGYSQSDIREAMKIICNGK